MDFSKPKLTKESPRKVTPKKFIYDNDEFSKNEVINDVKRLLDENEQRYQMNLKWLLHMDRFGDKEDIEFIKGSLIEMSRVRDRLSFVIHKHNRAKGD